MTLAVFAGQYHLLEAIGGSKWARVFSALDSNGHKVVVKFLLGQDYFFEELARYYAVDDSPNLPKVLFNFPPHAAGGDWSHEEPALIQSLKLESNSAGFIDEIGVLVLEHVEGLPLSDRLKRTDIASALDLLVRLARIIHGLHEFDEFHGDLTPRNVLLDYQRRDIRLIDFGFHAGKPLGDEAFLSPEHSPCSPHTVGKASDVYMFAKNFLSLIDSDRKDVKKMMRACLAFAPQKRPPIAKILRNLEQLASQEAFQAHAPLLRGRHPMFRFTATAAFLLFSAVAISRYYSGPVAEQRDHILQNIQDRGDTLYHLETLRGDTLSDQQARRALSADIANLRKPIADGELTTLDDSWHKPVAVFAFSTFPAVVGEAGVLLIGDWVQSDTIDRGYISNITSRGIAITSSEEEHMFSFEKPSFQVTSSLADETVLIWKRAGNIRAIAQALPKLAQAMHLDSLDMQALPFFSPLLQVEDTQDHCFGSISANNLIDFVNTWKRDLTVAKLDQAHLRLGTKQGHLAAYFQYTRLNISQSTVGEFLHLIENSLGVSVQAPSSLLTQPLPNQDLYQVSWSQALDKLGFEWHIDSANDEKFINVKNFAPKLSLQ